MRTTHLLATISTAAMILIQSCGTTNQPATKTTPAQQLLSRLETMRQKGVMFGHQDDPMYGLTSTSPRNAFSHVTPATTAPT